MSLAMDVIDPTRATRLDSENAASSARLIRTTPLATVEARKHTPRTTEDTFGGD